MGHPDEREAALSRLERKPHLRAFQRDSRDAAWTRLSDPRGTKRFLVADEVGLGKTRVAHGVIASLPARRNPSIVVYMAANAEILRQNLRVLRVGEEELELPPRITLLPLYLENVRKRGTHVLGFTPATSLRSHAGTGIARERALIARMVRRLWNPGEATEIEFFQASAVQGFPKALEEVEWSSIDPTIAGRFRRMVVADGGALATMRTLRPAARRGLSSDERTQANRAIRALRDLLAHACLDGLSTDLVILDEFHRYRDVLRQARDRGHPAHKLIGGTPTLLLSATPYRMAPGTDSLTVERDLFDLLTFLYDDEVRAKRVRSCFEALAEALVGLRGGETDGAASAMTKVQTAKRALESELREVMSRQERPVHEAKARPTRLTPSTTDVVSYVRTQRIVDEASQQLGRRRNDTLELWKSAPFVINFMRDYRAKETLRTALRGGQSRAHLVRELSKRPAVLLPWGQVERRRRLAVPNARYRDLEQRVLEDGQWQALWVPPTLPPYLPDRPFTAAWEAKATKSLVFSGWRVVPGATASLLGHEADRRALPAARARRSARHRGRQLLAFRFDRRQGPQGLGAFTVTWPSRVLAEKVDPYLASRGREDLVPLSEAHKAARRALEPLVVSATTQYGSGRSDAWYWAAPLLLDYDEGIDVVAELGRSGKLARSVWASRREGEAIENALAMARAVVQDRTQLGPPPKDLLDVVAWTALGGAGTCALRALSHILPQDADASSTFLAAARIGWALRVLLNRPDASQVVELLPRQRMRSGRREPFWRLALRYCSAGALQGVLDEYLFLLAPDVDSEDRAKKISEAAAAAIELEAVRVGADDPPLSARVARPFRQRFMTSRFAVPFGAAMAGEEAGPHPELIRQAFNSPFWPWVLITTSVGQEGLDFHRYCRSLVHWNVPSSVVELEQREGRIQRFLSHSVRQAMAKTHGPAALESENPWESLLEHGRVAAPKEDVGFRPEWTSGNADDGINRHVPVLSFSRDYQRFLDVQRARVYYRLVLGQPHPDELVEILMQSLDPELAARFAEHLRIDLAPTPVRGRK